jgi:hypothetical protein
MQKSQMIIDAELLAVEALQLCIAQDVQAFA